MYTQNQTTDRNSQRSPSKPGLPSTQAKGDFRGDRPANPGDQNMGSGQGTVTITNQKISTSPSRLSQGSSGGVQSTTFGTTSTTQQQMQSQELMAGSGPSGGAPKGSSPNLNAGKGGPPGSGPVGAGKGSPGAGKPAGSGPAGAPQGDQGKSGPAGTSVTTGPAGASGTTGPAATGKVGPGTTGPSAAGKAGPAGAAGTSGSAAAGKAGPATSGPSASGKGAPGTSGAGASPGTSGPTGAAGTSGSAAAGKAGPAISGTGTAGKAGAPIGASNTGASGKASGASTGPAGASTGQAGASAAGKGAPAASSGAKGSNASAGAGSGPSGAQAKSKYTAEQQKQIDAANQALIAAKKKLADEQAATAEIKTKMEMAQEFVELKKNLGNVKTQQPQTLMNLNKSIETYEKEMIEVKVNLKREFYIKELAEMKQLNKGQVLQEKKIKEWKDEIAQSKAQAKSGTQVAQSPAKPGQKANAAPPANSTKQDAASKLPIQEQIKLAKNTNENLEIKKASLFKYTLDKSEANRVLTKEKIQLEKTHNKLKADLTSMGKSAQYSVPQPNLKEYQTEYDALQKRQTAKRDTLPPAGGASSAGNARSTSMPKTATSQSKPKESSAARSQSAGKPAASKSLQQAKKDKVTEKVNSKGLEVDGYKKEFIKRQVSSEKQLRENQAHSMQMIQEHRAKIEEFKTTQAAKQEEIQNLKQTNTLLEQTLENLVVDEMEAKSLLETQ